MRHKDKTPIMTTFLITDVDVLLLFRLKYRYLMELFISKLEAYINNLDFKKRHKYTIKDDTYTKILDVLRSKPTDTSPKFKFWAKQSFRVISVVSSEIIVSKKNNLPIVSHENLYDKIRDCHIAVGHSGRDKTWAEVDIREILPDV